MFVLSTSELMISVCASFHLKKVLCVTCFLNLSLNEFIKTSVLHSENAYLLNRDLANDKLANGASILGGEQHGK